jgi:hypothetical protein
MRFLSGKEALSSRTLSPMMKEFQPETATVPSRRDTEVQGWT